MLQPRERAASCARQGMPHYAHDMSAPRARVASVAGFEEHVHVGSGCVHCSAHHAERSQGGFITPIRGYRMLRHQLPAT